MSLQVKKSKDRFSCPPFLNYVRALPCEDCNALGSTQKLGTTASHLVSVKWADGSDALAVPQCLDHHPQSSAQAESLLVTHGVDVEALHVRLWVGFLAEHGRNVVLPMKQEDFERICWQMGFTRDAFTRRKNRK